MQYRAEIDGLRAVAVVPVILFHAGFELFSGGFVGVDIFFVISGYLITTILIEDIENKRFSILDFYERRARRILPALCVVMAACIPFAFIWMIPTQLKDFSASLVAVSLFFSNILFWRESGYFESTSEDKPLLHTWSLAVEEQYYLLFPVFLILTWRFGKDRVFWMIALFSAISLLLSEWGWRNFADANFYLAPTRAWELFSGSIAAFIVQKRGVQNNNLLATLGLSAVFFSIFVYDGSTPFPSAYALLPIIGTVLIILYGETRTFAAKLLSLRVFVGIGLISYSAYLWHQPLFAFARIRLIEEPTLILMGGLSIMSFVLAAISWKFIENPFRNKQIYSRAKIFTLAGIATFLFCSVGTISYIYIKKPDEQNERLGEVNWRKCLNSGGNHREDFITNPCIYESKSSGEEKIYLIGDSHAQVLHYDLAQSEAFPFNIALYAGGSCPPLYSSPYSKCADFHFDAAQYILGQDNPEYVILSARWSAYTRVRTFEFRKGEVVSINPFGNDQQSVEDVQNEIKKLIEFWINNDIAVIFVTDYPTNGRNIKDAVAKMIKFDGGLKVGVETISQEEYREWISPVTEIIKTFDTELFTVVDSYRAICGDQEICDLITAEGPLLKDDNHASILGQRKLAAQIVKELNKNLSSN